MHAAGRPYVMAGAALAAASVVAVTPVEAQLRGIPVVTMATRLVDSDSILNVPLNLLYDVMNIPYNEIGAIDSESEALLFSSTWSVGTATNLWGEDPGDPGHFEGLVNMLLPFPALSGMGSGEYDWDAGLGQQLVGLLNAEIPVSSFCDAELCSPLSPSSPITGITLLDITAWWTDILSGQEKFPLFENWFQVPLSELTSGYTYGSNDPGAIDPSGPANTITFDNGPFPSETFYGTTPGPDGENLMPWANDTFTLNLSQPFENFFNSLMAPPPTDGILGTGIELPTLTEGFQAVQDYAAAFLNAFDEFTPGSPWCDAECGTLVTQYGLDYPDLIKYLNAVPNPVLTEWLDNYAAGTANVPTPAEILDNTNNEAQGFWDFGNPSPDPSLNVGGFDLSSLAPEFQTLWTDLGLYQPAGAAASGLDLSALPTDLTSLLSLGGASDIGSQLSADFSTLLADAGTTLPANLSTLAVDLLSSI